MTHGDWVSRYAGPVVRCRAVLRKGWDMSGTNAELIKAARSAAHAGREHAENYSGGNPADSIPWQNADIIDKLADALRSAEAERDAALAVIGEARNQVRAGISERALMRILQATK